jgi:hypothetical protein
MALALSVAVVLQAGSAWAATLTVQDTTDDAGTTACTGSGPYTCLTLRDAVDFAGAGSAGANPSIQLGPHTYTLLNNELDVEGPMTISGNGPSGTAASVIEQSKAGSRVLSVPVGTASLTLVDLAVTGGQLRSTDGSGVQACDPTSGQAFGGGVCSESPLTLIDVAVTDNHATGAAATTATANGDPAVGGAIYATEGLSLTGSTVSGNTAAGGAGASGTPTQSGGQGGVAGSAVTTSSGSITDSTISDNVATGGDGGPGINSPEGSMSGAGGNAEGAVSATSVTISGSTLSGNDATGGNGGQTVAAGVVPGAGGSASGGGLFAKSMSISSSTFSGNHVTGGAGGDATGTGLRGGLAGAANGGGILVFSNPSVISLSTVISNTATTGASGTASGGQGFGAPAAGGGIADGNTSDPGDSPGAPLTITGTTIANNTVTAAGNVAGQANPSDAYGGGVAATVGATATIVNSTVFGNEVSAPAAGNAHGGGFDTEDADSSITLASDTIVGNQASASTAADTFGGSLGSGSSAAVTVEDSIVTGAGAAATHSCQTDGGTLTDGGHNLEDDSTATCGFSATNHDLVGANPELPAVLGSNGGPTQTLAPEPGSPVIRAGGACTDPTLSPAGSLGTDQRGDRRLTSCDIGAFQTEPIAVTGAPSVSGHVITGSVVRCATGSLSISGDGARSSAGAIGAPAVAFAWLRNGKAIRGATASGLLIPQADVHAHLSCTESVSGAYGHGSATSRAVKIAALAPVISKLVQASRKWHETGRKHGTTFTLALNEPARLTLTFSRGRRTAGKLTVKGHTGRNRIHFAGRISRRHLLAPARYKLTIRASADGLRSRARTLAFTVL